MLTCMEWVTSGIMAGMACEVKLNGRGASKLLEMGESCG